MRYKKGSKVEVLTKRGLPSGSWWRARVISGNGYTYSVKYEPSPSGTTELVERVSRKVIRPCPPVVQGHMSWVAGDIVEVFNNGSWKIGEVASAVGGNFLSVRLLGSTGTFKVHRSGIRHRQCWQGNSWTVIGGKDARNSDDRELLKHECLKSVNQRRIEGSTKVQNYEHITAIEDSTWVTSCGKKRGLRYGCPLHEMCHRTTNKIKACDGDGRFQQLAAVNPYYLQEKVDAVASPQKMLGEKYMHASLNDRTGHSELDMEREKPYGDVSHFCAGILEPSNASVCSSSGSNDLDMLYHHMSTGPCLDMGSLSDDADSSIWSKPKKKVYASTEDIAAKIHKLELHAYRTTMEALYSSGPITWEQEELMTNLRLELHISIDEHLLELRHLSSSRSNLLSCVDAAPPSLSAI